MVCAVLKSAEKTIVSLGAATSIASLKEQSALLQMPSLVSTIFVTVSVAAVALAAVKIKHAHDSKIIRLIQFVMFFISSTPVFKAHRRWFAALESAIVRLRLLVAATNNRGSLQAATSFTFACLENEDESRDE